MQISSIFTAGISPADRDGDRDRDRWDRDRDRRYHEDHRRHGGRWDYDWRHRDWYWHRW